MAKREQKIRKNIMLKPELNLMVKEAAGKYSTSESAVIEKALEKFLVEGTSELPEFFNYAGSVECEHPTLSKKYKNIAARRQK